MRAIAGPARLAPELACPAEGAQVSGRFDMHTGLQTMRSGRSPKFDTFFWRDGTHLFNLTFRSDSTRPLPPSDPRALPPEAVRAISRACDSLRLNVEFARVDLLRSRPTAAMPSGLALGEVTLGPNGGFAGFPREVDQAFANWWCDVRNGSAEAAAQLPRQTLPSELRQFITV